MIILFVDNLFFYLGGQSVSCKASLAALRLYGYFCDFFVWCYYRRINTMMMMIHTDRENDESVYLSYEKTYLSKDLRKGLVKQVNRLQRQ